MFWVFILSIPTLAVAIFEINLDMKHKVGPWGKTKFKNPYWEEKILQRWPIPFIKYISRYHAVLFLEVLPVVFTLSIIFWSWALNSAVWPSDSSRLIKSLSFITLFIAVWLGNSGFEDMFYFIIQSLTGWHEPHALRKVVLEKDFDWFKDWLPPIFGLNIPGHWVFCPAAALLLLYIRHHWIMQ